MPKKNPRAAVRRSQAAPPLPRWRWLIYAGIFAIVFVVMYRVSGGAFSRSWSVIQGDPNFRDAGFFGLLFGVLLAALAKVFIDPVFVGLAQHRSGAALAGELVTDLAKTAAQVAVAGVFDAAVGSVGGSSTGSSGKSGNDGVGGGGRSGGGGGGGSF